MNIGSQGHVITFARDKSFGLIGVGQKVLEGSKIVGREGASLEHC
jgi:hypothetical protein